MSSGSHRSRANPNPDEETWWEVVEIVAEDGKRFKVRWAGKDPKTGKPWPLTWVPISHCSPELIKGWEGKKAKERGSLASAPVSKLPQTPVARMRSSERRNATSTSEPTVHPTRKRKRPIHSASPSNIDEDSVPLRKKRLAAPIESGTDGGRKRDEQSAAHSHSPPNENDPPSTEDSPLHPPLEEIEAWVPTPDAKFGPPKRKRPAHERGDLPREGRADIAVSAVTSMQPLISLPSSRLPLNPSKSQIVALREEEEEESQLQLPELPTNSNRSGSPTQHTAPDDPPQPSAEDARDVAEESAVTSQKPPGQPTSHPAVDVQFTNGRVNAEHVLESDRDANYPQVDATNASVQGRGVTEDPKSRIPPPAPALQSPINPKAAAVAASSPESPKKEEPARSSPRPTAKSSASSAEQLSPSRIEPLLRGNGTLAERRAFEARVRLDELRRAAARFPGDLTRGQTSTLKTFQTAEQPLPHVMLQQAMTVLESPNQSQITAPSNPENIIFASASPGEGSRTYLSARSGDDLTPPNKSGQEDNFGRSPQRDGVVVANVSVVHDNERSSQDEVPPTASGSTHSQSHNTTSQASLGSQLAAALDLLHKKSEEISELQAQVNTQREQTTDGGTKLELKQAENGALNSRVECDHLAAAVQTDQKDGVLAQWAEEKTVLQGVAEALRADKARALTDVDFFREQYQKASDFASSMRSENEELLARATLAESQSINGVAMVRATFESRVAKLEAEVQKYKALSEMLTERARRTDDDVRYRAAIAPELEREYKQLHRQFRETEAELEDTKDELRTEKKVNSRLRRLVRRLEAKEQANEGKSPEQGQGPLPWSDAEDDSDYLPGATPPSCPSGGSDGSSSQHEQNQGPHNEEDAIIPVGGEIEQLTSAGPGESAQTSNNDMVYLCRWKSGEPNGNCDMVLTSKQELHEHVLSHHLACH